MSEGKPGKRHHQGRVAWIAMRKVVERELAEGWSARAVYDRHAAEFEGKLSYPQLVRYVRPLRAKEATPRPVAEKAPLPTRLRRSRRSPIRSRCRSPSSDREVPNDRPKALRRWSSSPSIFFTSTART